MTTSKLQVIKRKDHYTSLTSYKPVADGRIILGGEVGVCGSDESDCIKTLERFLALKGFDIRDFQLVEMRYGIGHRKHRTCAGDVKTVTSIGGAA